MDLYLVRSGIRGEHESFVRDDELLRAWELFSPLLEKIEDGKKARNARHRLIPRFLWVFGGFFMVCDVLLGFQWLFNMIFNGFS